MNTIHELSRLVSCVLLSSALLLSTGCRGPWSNDWKYSDLLSPKKMVGWGDDEPQPEVPRRVVASWTDTVLHQTGKTPQRGFGGRLIFYGEKDDKPVLVDGQLVVYAFNETNRDPTDNKPTKRYVFPPDQVARRMSMTELGPSYSFWLPWDEVGGPQTDISLIARFEPKGGALVVGEQTRHLLPGILTPEAMLASQPSSTLPHGIPTRPTAPTLASLAKEPGATGNPLQLANYDAPAGEPLQPATPERRMTTTSISLPANFRISPSGTPQPIPSGNIVLPGSVIAAPQAPPPNYNALAKPLAVPRPTGNVLMQPTMVPFSTQMQTQGTNRGFMTPQLSPTGGSFVAPVGQPNFAPQPVPGTVGQLGVPAAAPLMPGQPPLTTAAGWATVTYQPVPGQPGSTTTGQPSFGYPPTSPQAPATPVSR